jgi:hypothetical protein
MAVFNFLKPSGYFTCHQVQHSTIPSVSRIDFTCFVRLSEQTVTFGLGSINRRVFVTETGSVYSAVRSESLYKIRHVSSLKG